jgi:hypothetical protein
MRERGEAMSELNFYPWNTDYKKIWGYIKSKIESEYNEHIYGVHNLGLIFAYNDKIISDISWISSLYEPYESKTFSLFIGFDPVCESLCNISEYEEFQAWAKSINLRFLDPNQDALRWRKYPEEKPAETMLVLILWEDEAEDLYPDVLCFRKSECFDIEYTVRYWLPIPPLEEK